MRNSLPDAIDLLTVSVEAGWVSTPPWTGSPGTPRVRCPQEFARLLQEMQIGVGRTDAMRAMAERTSLADLKSFCLAMVQADSLGIPIGRVLRIQSREMRTKRRQRAEEKAQQVPVRMMIPLVLFILPVSSSSSSARPGSRSPTRSATSEPTPDRYGVAQARRGRLAVHSWRVTTAVRVFALALAAGQVARAGTRGGTTSHGTRVVIAAVHRCSSGTPRAHGTPGPPSAEDAAGRGADRRERRPLQPGLCLPGRPARRRRCAPRLVTTVNARSSGLTTRELAVGPARQDHARPRRGRRPPGSHRARCRAARQLAVAVHAHPGRPPGAVRGGDQLMAQLHGLASAADVGLDSAQRPPTSRPRCAHGDRAPDDGLRLQSTDVAPSHSSYGDDVRGRRGFGRTPSSAARSATVVGARGGQRARLPGARRRRAAGPTSSTRGRAEVADEYALRLDTAVLFDDVRRWPRRRSATGSPARCTTASRRRSSPSATSSTRSSRSPTTPETRRAGRLAARGDQPRGRPSCASPSSTCVTSRRAPPLRRPRRVRPRGEPRHRPACPPAARRVRARRCPSRTETELLRVAQEAIGNVRRHAQLRTSGSPSSPTARACGSRSRTTGSATPSPRSATGDCRPWVNGPTHDRRRPDHDPPSRRRHRRLPPAPARPASSEGNRSHEHHSPAGR